MAVVTMKQLLDSGVHFGHQTRRWNPKMKRYMLTNFQTVHKRLQRLKELESMEQTGGFEGRTKKEILMLTREKDKLEKTLGGIRDMSKVPSAVWIVDTKKEHI